MDECHRGSAADDSAWRERLEYFSTATQIGMTATPKEDLYTQYPLYVMRITGNDPQGVNQLIAGSLTRPSAESHARAHWRRRMGMSPL